MVNNNINIEVVYAEPDQNWIVPLVLKTPVDIQAAIIQSNILNLCPEIDLAVNKVGIYGEILDLSHKLKNHDRVEIYRPIIIDPMTKRHDRVKKMRKNKLKSRE